MFFNERFEFVEEGSMVKRVIQPGDGAAALVLSNIKAPKNGYAYIYLSNENDDAVYWDNFIVSYTRGKIIEENHYYAFGLRIAGISSRKFDGGNEGELVNHYLYNDKELFEDADLDWYDYGFRNYDPQIARFTQLDPLTWDYPELTNYQYASNEPIANVDMDGLEKAQVLDPIVIFKDMGHNAANAFEKTMSNLIPLASKAINLASSVVQSQIANKSLNENLADQITKNVFNYYQENRNSMSLSDLWVLNNLSQNYYAGLNGMAWWRKTDFIKLQQNVSNSTLSPEQKIQLVELEIQKSQEEWRSVMQSGANAGLFISSLGLFPGMGLSPKSTLLKFGAQQTSARTSSIFSHITRKIAKQMSRRGWTRKLIHETVNNPFTTRSATNRATGNAATAYFRKNGSYVVKDNVTNEIIQISNRLDSHWVPDATIVNPYIP